MEKISSFKQEINYLRKSIRPAREAILKMSRLDSDLFQQNTFPFLKDLQDLINHATEATETYRDLLTDQLNIYNSVMGNKMNDIMKVLTIFAAIFIPLTFIAGIYGTNLNIYRNCTINTVIFFSGPYSSSSPGHCSFISSGSAGCRKWICRSDRTLKRPGCHHRLP